MTATTVEQPAACCTATSEGSVVRPGGGLRERAGFTVLKAVAWCGAAALTATIVPSLADRWWEAPEKLERARVAFRAEQPALAADLASEAFAADPTLDDAAAVLLAARAAEAETSGEWEPLVRAARTLAERRPHDAADVGNAALVLLNAGHCEEAAGLYRDRIELGADDAETRISLAEATLCSVGDDGLRAAVAVLDRAPGEAAAVPELLLSRAVLRAAAGRDGEARLDLARAERARPSAVGVDAAVSCLRQALPAAAPAPVVDPNVLASHAEAVFAATEGCRTARR